MYRFTIQIPCGWGGWGSKEITSRTKLGGYLKYFLEKRKSKCSGTYIWSIEKI